MFRLANPCVLAILLISTGLVFGRFACAETVSHVGFHTDEGTWMSLDVSPDGRTILMELLGDIYSLPMAGGRAKPLIAGKSFDSQPRYSPDGTQIAFISDRSGEDNIWLSDAAGRVTTQVSHEISAEMFSPAWSADGQSLLVSKISHRRSMTKGAELWRYPLDDSPSSRIDVPSSGKLSLLVSSVPTGPFGPIASPDGKSIFFASPTPRQAWSLKGPVAQVLRHDIDTGITERVTFRREGAFKPTISPDGRWLAFGARRSGKTGLRIRDMGSGEERWLAIPIQRDALEARATRDILPNFAFTPDSSHLLISYGGKIHRIEVQTGDTRIVPFFAEVALDVTPRLDFPASLDEGPVRARVVQTPELSPDGSQIAFSAFGELYVTSTAGGTLRRVTKPNNGGGFHPAWSPNGNWLAFVSWNARDGGHIWKVASNGNQDPERLTSRPAFYRNPVWTPDAGQILAITAPRDVRLINDAVQMSAAEQIIRLPSNGGRERRVAPAEGAVRPHFGKEADRFYSYSMSGGLVSRRLDGSDKKLHLRVVGEGKAWGPARTRDVLISPDGSQALALVSSQLFAVRMDDIPDDQPQANVYSGRSGIDRLTMLGADHFSWTQSGNTITWSAGATIYAKHRGHAHTREYEAIVERPRRVPQGWLVLRSAAVITMRGEEVIDDADVVIERNRVAAVGPRGTVHIPPGATIVNVEGKTIMPGIVDIHAHWEIKRSVLDVEDFSAYANLAYGVTTIRDPQSVTADIFAYSDLVAIGEMVGPRIFSTGVGVFPENDFQSYEEVRNSLSRYSEKYKTHLLKSYLVGNRQVRRWVVQACRELGLMATTEGGADTKMDLTHAIDGFSGIEHSLPTTPLFADVIELYAQTGITYTPTLLVAFGGPFARNEFFVRENVLQDAKLRRFIPETILYRQSGGSVLWSRPEEQVFQQMAGDAARLLEAGGSVGLGGHGELQGLQVHWEMWSLAAGGMRAHDVLRVATLESAEAIGLGDEIGSIEVGKAADLIVLDENPLNDIRNTDSASYVMTNGILYDAKTLDEIWPMNTPLPSPWWTVDQP